MTGFLCENLCEKNVPKSAKTGKIDKNVKIIFAVISYCY